MIKCSRILTALTFYHGRNMTRPYTGKYLFLTSDPAYACSYSDGKTIQTYELSLPLSKIFSLRKADDISKLSQTMNNPAAIKSIMDASNHGELDWAACSNICSEDFPDAESLLESLGFSGVWLNEREGINSILLFDQKDATFTGTEPAVFKQTAPQPKS